jgi:aryl-alcohol dehydrogenase-like predicted oxidoreductase
MEIEKAAFGSTGHRSTRIIFGAAALAAMRQERADRVLETLFEFGINHIDTAASYGDAELRLGPWIERYRDRFFLASKTGERNYAAARDSIHRSLERMKIDRLDLIQLHNLVDSLEWEQALGPGGALEAAIEAREAGLVRFIGVTGHGTRVAAMHRKSLERFAFDSVLLPYNFTMMSQPDYAADFEALYEICAERGVAMQTIKSVARRRWRDDDEAKRFSWYEPMQDRDALQRNVRWVLSRPRIFLNSSSDANLLKDTLSAASSAGDGPSDEQMVDDVERLKIEPLFVRGELEGI